jgi:hypothetical protein
MRRFTIIDTLIEGLAFDARQESTVTQWARTVRQRR